MGAVSVFTVRNYQHRPQGWDPPGHPGTKRQNREPISVVAHYKGGSRHTTPHPWESLELMEGTHPRDDLPGEHTDHYALRPGFNGVQTGPKNCVLPREEQPRVFDARKDPGLQGIP